jgi:EmrB/QacA subfamily drug resistance transporter
VVTVQWVVEAYALTLAALVLVGGALGDRYGRRRMFSLGVLIFALASGGCGAAPSPWALVVARAVQGVGAALLVPGSLSLISAAYDEEARGAAIGTWSAASAVTSAIGPIAGGFLVAHASWRWLFVANVPLGVVVLWFARRHVPESRADTGEQAMDWAGTLLLISGLGVLVYGLLEGSGARGRLRPNELLAITAGLCLLVAFGLVERRQRAPIVPPALFRSRTFSGANLLTLLLYAALGAGLFFLPFDLVQVQGYSPTAAGAALAPFVLAISAMSRWAGGLTARYGARPPLVLGPLIAALGFVLLAMPARSDNYWTSFFPGVLVLGLGMGITVAPLTTAVMQALDQRHAGLASGINNAVARGASLLAVAALGLVLTARFDAALDAKLATLGLPNDLLHALDAQRDKLAAADLSVAPQALRGVLRGAIDDAFVAGFRTLMLVSAGLAALSGAFAAWLIGPATLKSRA